MTSQVSHVIKDIWLRSRASDVYKIILMKSGFVFNPVTHKTYADVSASELDTDFGYIHGGNILAGAAVSIDEADNSARLTFNETVWTANGGNLIASGAIIFNDSLTLAVDGYEDGIVDYIDFGSNQNAESGKVLKIQNIYIKL
jgi:hypothetical protein